MTETQILTIVLASAPTMITVLIGILINDSRLNDLRSDVNSRMGELGGRISETNARISNLRTHMDHRFDDMRDTWRSELHRVEEVLGARLKHLEKR